MGVGQFNLFEKRINFIFTKYRRNIIFSVEIHNSAVFFCINFIIKCNVKADLGLYIFIRANYDGFYILTLK